MPTTRRELLRGGLLAAAAWVLPTRRVRAADGGGVAPTEASATEASLGVARAARTAVAAGACPGVAVRVARGGTTLLSREEGLANLETNTPVGPDAVFRVGSLTKQFTAALLLKLAAQGRLKLDDPVHRHLSFFPADTPVTLQELAQQTAGLRDDEADGAGPCAAPGQITQVDLARAVAGQKRPFEFPPGTAWRYSNANYVVLGAVVEQVTGRPLAEAAAALLFRPLGLERTAFDTSADVVRGRVEGYTRAKGAPSGWAHAEHLDVALAGGAGAMRSCTADLCRWHHALFSHQVFEARWTAAMTTPGRLRDGQPSGSRRFSPEDASYGDTQYGMGLLLPPPGKTGRTALHYGYINGFSALLESHLDLGLTTAVLCNADPGPALPFRGIRDAVVAHLARKV